jgi:hypothetical protein
MRLQVSKSQFFEPIIRGSRSPAAEPIRYENEPSLAVLDRTMTDEAAGRGKPYEMGGGLSLDANSLL